MSRTRVAVIFGGRSSEHAISCLSAAGVLRALDPQRYEVVPVGILPDGRWVLASGDPAGLEPVGRALPAVSDTGTELALVSGGLRLQGEPGLPRGIDVAFPLLHGAYGEDGTIQGLLELAGVPYVGSGVFASAAAMDKQHMKTLLAGAGLPIGPYAVVRPGERADPDFAGPWFVKPARAGSSFGITKVADRAGLAAAVETARAHDPKVLVEQMVLGREVECGVLGGEVPAASLPAEVHVSGHEFYDFDAKYREGEGTTFDIPAELDEGTTRAVQSLALQAFSALDAEGIARVDFFLTDGGPVLNEVNTMPGFTPLSLYPRMWAASGVPYAELVDRLVADALRRGTGLR